MILQTAFELAKTRKEPLFAVFVDLTNAYDTIDRRKLFTALVQDLGVRGDTLQLFIQMYTSIRAQVVIDGNLSHPFDLHLGVRQGCPASPLVFSLFMDRREEWIACGVSDLTAREQDAARVAGMLIPMLLFADDIVLMGRQRALV